MDGYFVKRITPTFENVVKRTVLRVNYLASGWL